MRSPYQRIIGHKLSVDKGARRELLFDLPPSTASAFDLEGQRQARSSRAFRICAIYTIAE
jgi:hypothetical protein